MVEDLDSSVEEFKIGDRVAYMSAGTGAYATFRTVNAEKLVAVPDGLSDEVIAAHFFKGLTAQYLIQKTFPVEWASGAPAPLPAVSAPSWRVGPVS
ncbi:hypothetical protein NLY43_25630 [Mesorhizobium sp. C416B]|uniref:hypothetical protein n=1 Tax=unclassified Mesorhizobium TaxID=325217 RepID=UPI0003CED45F|nr:MULTISPECIES: hypothetical protein [unclassified Mesorhizobium]ESX49445.1 hypothetical protein X762_12435 [Mesorhizobium sp. LSHC426A00]WJI61956.1 hypothetical protein NLY43_25630 [Mesorhizobium sp. C416B]